ncbi:MAG: BlaI/MecI/CopY family transcriptional regulator [Planctomycetota bacterium]|jgi:predicted transcriptional regulator
MARKDFKLTEGEWEIIQAVWETEPCAAPTVQEKLKAKKKWSYSTVKTFATLSCIVPLLRKARPKAVKYFELSGVPLMVL